MTTAVRYVTTALLLCSAAWASTAVRAQGDPTSDDRIALAYGRSGQWEVAARQWSDTAAARAVSSADAPSKRVAARSLVLATIAWERATDSRAYVTWADAVRLFLESGTTWEQERQRIKAALEQVDQALRQAQSGPGHLVVASSAELLQIDLDRELGLTAFAGPRPGLGSSDVKATDQPLGMAGSFFPRTPFDGGSGTSSEEFPEAIALARTFAPVPSATSGPDLNGERVDVMPSLVSSDAVGVVPAVDPGVATPPIDPDPLEARALPVDLALAPVPASSSLAGARNRDVASAAWAYFERNVQAATGMVSAVAGYPHATMWDTGSALAGFVCARELGLIDDVRFDALMVPMLTHLRSLALYNNELPNREYDVTTSVLLDSRSHPSAQGSGWSAMDLGRMLVWLRIVRTWYPRHAALVDGVVARWRFDRAVNRGELYGTLRDEGIESLRQEGRLGYEQYAAAGFALWNKRAELAMGTGHRVWTQVDGVRVPRDTRSHAFMTSEPFMLATLELGGLSDDFKLMTRAVYDVQRRHAASTGSLVAVSEDSLDREPWFIYNTIWFGASAWAPVSPSGRVHPESRSLSAKAAFAWDAIYDDDYTVRLRDAVQPLVTSAGVRAGLFDHGVPNASLNINTNAVLLEALLYKARGGRPFLETRTEGVRK